WSVPSVGHNIFWIISVLLSDQRSRKANRGRGAKNSIARLSQELAKPKPAQAKPAQTKKPERGVRSGPILNIEGILQFPFCEMGCVLVPFLGFHLDIGVGEFG
ncbi:hypothetical protein, partial [Pseudogemmobacter humi]|uniref:hypothetical protein n=1 Tax=Pseudogemmobacter humi TaxID=2483812 RepID=UPI003F491764